MRRIGQVATRNNYIGQAVKGFRRIGTSGFNFAKRNLPKIIDGVSNLNINTAMI